jgi:hypothetical protein
MPLAEGVPPLPHGGRGGAGGEGQAANRRSINLKSALMLRAHPLTLSGKSVIDYAGWSMVISAKPDALSSCPKRLLNRAVG